MRFSNSRNLWNANRSLQVGYCCPWNGSFLFPIFWINPVHLRKLILYLFTHLFLLKTISSHTSVCFFHMSMLSALSRCLRFLVWKPAAPLCPRLPAWWPAAGTGRSWCLLRNACCGERTKSFPGAGECWLSLTPHSTCPSLAAMWKPLVGQARVITHFRDPSSKDHY